MGSTSAVDLASNVVPVWDKGAAQEEEEEIHGVAVWCLTVPTCRVLAQMPSANVCTRTGMHVCNSALCLGATVQEICGKQTVISGGCFAVKACAMLTLKRGRFMASVRMCKLLGACELLRHNRVPGAYLSLPERRSDEARS